jgi:hypothetical protein
MFSAISTAFKRSWLYPVFVWSDVSILTVAFICCAVLCIWAAHRRLSICQYILLSTAPLFLGLSLSVMLSVYALWPWFSGQPFEYIGAPEDEFVSFALFRSGVGLVCTAFLYVAFGLVVLIVGRTKGLPA